MQSQSHLWNENIKQLLRPLPTRNRTKRQKERPKHQTQIPHRQPKSPTSS